MSPAAQYVVQATITLIGIGLLAVLLVSANRRWAASKPRGPLDLLGQLPLDARRSVYLVQVDATVYVVAASEHAIVKLGELDRSQLPEALALPPRSFADVLAGAFGRRTSTPPSRRSATPREASNSAASNSAPPRDET